MIARESTKTWRIWIDDLRCIQFDGVSQIEILVSGALVLTGPGGVWLAAFPPGGWQNVMPAEEA